MRLGHGCGVGLPVVVPGTGAHIFLNVMRWRPRRARARKALDPLAEPGCIQGGQETGKTILGLDLLAHGRGCFSLGSMGRGLVAVQKQPRP